jgi:hypothetical protein
MTDLDLWGVAGCSTDKLCRVDWRFRSMVGFEEKLAAATGFLG